MTEADEIQVEQFYPLCPVQQGMLYHCIGHPDSGMYVNQVCGALSGRLDTGALDRAWQAVIDRHAILRTAFVWEDVDEPVQVVCGGVALQLQIEDWRERSEQDQGRALESFLIHDRMKGFDLASPPLMRFSLIRLGETTWRLVWSHHHLILDGWSVGLVLNELFAFYEAFAGGQSLTLEKPRPYSDYIDWLSNRDGSHAKLFWIERLNGFRAPTSLGMTGNGRNKPAKGGDYGVQQTSLSASVTDRVTSSARKAGLTLNTIVQGVWALIISRYSGDRDVVYGTTFSGRSASLEGIERIVGLFINTLPVRVRVSLEQPTLAMLLRLQDDLIRIQEFESTPLVEVQKWSEVPRRAPLFESILGFENLPGS
ncbi:MAG: condensation domain-containing protein, partial [Blastocatellia bacterium]